VNKKNITPYNIDKQILNQKSILKFSSVKSSHSGLIATEHGPLFVVIQPILHNDFTGPQNGSLIMGRFLQDSVLKELKIKSGFGNICFIPINSKFPMTSINCQGENKNRNNNIKDEINLERSDDKITGQTLLYDVNARKSYVISAYVDRKFYKQGKQNVVFINAIIIFVTSVIALLVIYILDLLVINRLSGVGKSLREIAESGNLSDRLPLSENKRQDELDVLTHDINQMLASFETSKNELYKNIAVRNSEKHYQQLIESLPTAVFIIQNNMFVFANCAGRQLIEIDDSVEISNLKIETVISTENIEYIDENKISESRNFESIVLLHGKTKYFDEYIIPFSFRNNPAVQVLVNDVTDRRNIERESETVREQLRALTFELMLTEDRERGRIAIDLHDEIGQSMIAARLMLGAVKDAPHMPDNQSKTIEEVRDILQESINWVRTLSIDLSPPVLRELGLEAGLQWLSNIFKDRHQLNVEVNMLERKIEFPESIRTIAFVTTRELLYNIVKHAKANNALIKLRLNNALLQITVSDDGIGMTDEQYDSIGQNGFGLFGIRERLKYIGGSMVIDKLASPGTTVILNIPFNIEQGEKMVKIIIVDDHKIVRQGLKSLIKNNSDYELVGEAGNGKDAVELVREYEPNIVIMDISLPEMTGIDATRLILDISPNTKVIALSMHDDRQIIQDMLLAGAVGYLLKESAYEELIDAINMVLSGQVYLSKTISDLLVRDYVYRLRNSDSGVSTLTPREREIWGLLADGMSSVEIAEKLYLSPRTVDTHRKNLMDKLKADNIAGLVKIAIREGIIKLD
jgi:DNA-binding NarL/FixJ family response regulator/signal transduction histidine kinase